MKVRTNGPRVSMLLLVGAGSLLMAGSAAGAAGQGKRAASNSTPSNAAQFEAGVKGSAGGEIFRAMELHYPMEYRALMDELYRKAEVPSGNVADLTSLSYRLTREFYGRRVADLVNAPAAVLNAINTRQLALIRGLARDNVAHCAEYATTGFSAKTQLSAADQAQVSSLAVRIIEASKLGVGRPPGPGRQALADVDARAWYERVLEVEPSKEVQAALLQEDTTGLAAEMQCRIGVAVYAAIDKLPSEQAANLTAYFLAQSYAEKGTK